VTMFGGDLLPTEVTVVPGKGKMTLTGKLGDVMQESAQAAMSYIRSRCESFGLMRDFHARVDLHVHFPEGAIPKDGPSAGITMATAMASALLRIPVRQNIAMTGEITLRGRVLPIGGLKEKVLAAHRAGVTLVVIPEDNTKDLKDIPEGVLAEISIVPVKHMDEVLRVALAVANPDTFLTEATQVVDWRTTVAEPTSEPH
jgi:ATP-dependent Lon protease